jgi:predicted DNA-binding transcriptional regulator YafY
MKEFLKTNTVTYNLMSFTAFKSILLFTLLIEGPKSYEEMQKFFKNHEYLHENISIDTLRIYLNSLKEIGCKISKKTIDGTTRYWIDSHPFSLKFNEKQIKSIIKIYKAISKNIEVRDLIALQNFFTKISQYVENEELKLKLQNISPISNIDYQLIIDLLKYAQNNTEISIYYNSANSGKKDITILVDRVFISNNKLYISGINSEYNTYSSFLVSKIIKIISVNINEKTLSAPELTVGYQYTKDDNENFELLDNEKIIKDKNNILTIEITSKNKFEITQRIMSHSLKCKVLYPQSYKEDIISTLKRMKEGYIEKQ